MKRIALAAIMSVAAALPAVADELVLKNGARIQGRVTEAGNVVTVEMDMGTMTFRRSEVSKVVLGQSTLQELDQKVRELDSDDVDGRFKLAVWAKQRELTNRSRELLEAIILADPEHAGARAELGYVKHEGRWMTDAARRAAQGLTLFRGAWVKQSEAEDVLQREQDRDVQSALDGQMIRAQADLLAAEAEYLRAKAERERTAARIESDRNTIYGPVWGWSYGAGHAHVRPFVGRANCHTKPSSAAPIRRQTAPGMSKGFTSKK